MRIIKMLSAPWQAKHRIEWALLFFGKNRFKKLINLIQTITKINFSCKIFLTNMSRKARKKMSKLYIGNLSFDTTSDTLTEVFSKFGTVASANIIMDKFTNRSKGFGFVEFEDESCNFKAIEAMNGRELDGRKIRVSEAQEKAPRISGGFGGHRGPRNFGECHSESENSY